MILAFVARDPYADAASSPVWEIIVLAALLGVVNAFDIPARQAFLVRDGGPRGPDERHRAELVDVQRRARGRAGDRGHPGGVRSARAGASLPTRVSYIAVIAGLLMMRLAPFARAEQRRRRRSSTSSKDSASCCETRPIRAMLLLLGLRQSGWHCPYSVLMPDLRRQNSAWRRASARHSDGRGRSGRAGGRADAGNRARGLRGLGPMDRDFRARHSE